MRKLFPSEKLVLARLIFPESYDVLLDETGLPAGALRDDLINLINYRLVEVMDPDHKKAKGTSFYDADNLHVSKPSDLIPELQGRFPIRVELNSLTESDFIQILSQPKNALTKQYIAMLASEGVEITFTDDAVDELARIAAEVNAQVENIGARRLHTIMSSLFDELLFAVPDDINSGAITIDKAYVEKQLAGLVKDKDLSHYIL